MPWVEALTDINDLRRCIRDLVALSTLPAVWTNYGPSQIANSAAAALLSMLGADFVYIALPPDWGEAPIEAVHVGRRWTIPLGGETAIRGALHNAWLGRPEQTGVIANPVGHGTISVVAVPIGFQGDAVVIAGSRGPKFPTDTQRLLLGIAANATTVALQRRSAELEERRFVSLVERSTDFISIVSLDGAPHYVNPAGLRLVGLETLEQARRLHVADFLLPEERARAREMCWPEAIRTGRWRGELIFRNFETGRALPFWSTGSASTIPIPRSR